jgi:hypothetical protein
LWLPLKVVDSFFDALVGNHGRAPQGGKGIPRDLLMTHPTTTPSCGFQPAAHPAPPRGNSGKTFTLYYRVPQGPAVNNQPVTFCKQSAQTFKAHRYDYNSYMNRTNIAGAYLKEYYPDLVV